MSPDKAYSGPLPQPAEYSRRHLYVIAPSGTTLDDVAAPTWLRHYAKSFRKNDLVEIVAEDGSFDVIARVVSVLSGQVRLRPLFAWADNVAPVETRTEGAASAPDGVSVDFNSKQGWRVVADAGDVIAKGFATRDEAVAAKRAYLANPATELQAA